MDDFDPQEAFCHCGKPAVAEKFEGFTQETHNVDEDGDVIAEIVLLVCYECAHV